MTTLEFQINGVYFMNIPYLINNISNLIFHSRHRKKKYIELRGSTCRLINVAFECRLQTRRFRGELDFDHQNNELTIYVDPSGQGLGVNRR